MFEISEKMNTMIETLKEIGSENATMMPAVMCMLIDSVAMKMGMSSVEFVDMVRPIIESVNNEMGTEGVA